MSSIDELAKDISASRRNPTKAELTEFIKGTLELFSEVAKKYKEYFEGSEDSPALLGEIESKIQEIVVHHGKVFPGGPGTASIADELNAKFEEIKKYHDQLLVDGPDGESIKTDIADSKEKITNFYNELFGSEEGQAKAKHIRDFFDELTTADGVESESKRIFEEINQKYKELFVQNAKTKKSLVDELQDNIGKADKFKNYIDTELQPLIDDKKQRISEIDDDIAIKQGEVEALLSDATAKTLAQGFLESKAEYASGIPKKYNKLDSWKDWKSGWFNLRAFAYNNIARHLPNVLNYTLFIAPLVAITFIFTNKELAEVVLNGLSVDNANNTTRLEAVYAKTIISIPMIWIAWYGQRNISQRKRLREEYNHKYRVLQVYLLFLEGQNTYKLENQNRVELEKILLSSVHDNPAQHLGKSETYMDSAKDKIVDIVPFLGDKKGDIK
jgi:hypothetical protein